MDVRLLPYFGIGGVAKEKIQETFHHPRCIGFTGMHPRGNDHALLHWRFPDRMFDRRSRARDRKHMDEITGQCSAQYLLFAVLTFPPVALNVIQIVLEDEWQRCSLLAG